MKKNKLFALVLITVLVFGSAFGSGVSSLAQTQKKSSARKNPDVNPRIQHMLDLNRIYNNDFNDERAVLEEAGIALKDKAQNGYVPADAVKSFVMGMYSINADPSRINYPGCEQKAGYMPVVSRGYTGYSHQITSVEDAGDGTVTVFSKVTVDYHDGNPETLPCETLLCKNDESPFGYNIIYANIG